MSHRRQYGSSGDSYTGNNDLNCMINADSSHPEDRITHSTSLPVPEHVNKTMMSIEKEKHD